MANYKWGWDDAKGVPHDDARLELWAIRSLDGGQTWGDKQRLLDGYNADFTGFIQTRSGRLVATVEHLAADPARWVVCSFFSDDEGKSWRRSNWIDLGGHGHHDGATEPGVVELKDGRLMMIISTGLDRFWHSFSEDDGRYWRRLEPMALDASRAPCCGCRADAWPCLEPPPPRGPARLPSRRRPQLQPEVPASWHRRSCRSPSEDEGRADQAGGDRPQRARSLPIRICSSGAPASCGLHALHLRQGRCRRHPSARLNEEEFLRGGWRRQGR